MENIENAEKIENTEVIQENIKNIPSNKPAAFDFRDFFDRNRKAVTYGGGALLLVLLAVGFYVYRSYGQESEANNSAFRAEHLYGIDSVNRAMKGDGTPDVVSLPNIADDYSGTKAGQRAYYLIGMEKLKEGKYQDAIDNLEHFHLKSAIVYPLAQGAIGDAYSQLKQYDDAAKYYVRAAEANDNQYTTPKFYKKAALVYETQGKYQDALDCYKKIKDKYKNTPELMDMDKYIARVRAKNGGKE